MTEPAAEKPSVPRLEVHEIREPGKLKGITGAHYDLLSQKLVNQLSNTLWYPNGVTDNEDAVDQQRAAVYALEGLAPRDEAEGLLAVQMIACHMAAMECYRRAMLSGQSLESRGQNLNHANKLSRSYASLLETLDKHRGKGQQKVTVEHIHVHRGGQAIVGNVETGVGVATKAKETAHATIAHAPESTMRSPFEANGEPMPERLNGEWQVSDAWREIDGSAQGQ